MSDTSIEEMKEQLKLCSDAVIKNTKIITPGEIGQNYLLHISISKISEFIPYHSRISASSEDNTIPRVYTSPTLGGCVIGFSTSDYLTTNLIPNEVKGQDKNKELNSNVKGIYYGGLYIHKIPFDVALKPNKKLVFDAKETDETWLITYNENTRKFPATIIGKMIVSKLETIPRLGKLPTNLNTFLVEITDEDGIYLSKGTLLSKGYWKISVNLNTTEMFSEKINKAEFEKDRDLKASLLNFKESPACLKW